MVVVVVEKEGLRGGAEAAVLIATIILIQIFNLALVNKSKIKPIFSSVMVALVSL